MYSHLCIYVLMYLNSNNTTHNISEWAAGSPWWQFAVHLKMMIEWCQKCTLRPWLSKFGDALGDQDQVNSAIHLEAIMERECRGTQRTWMCEHGWHNRVTLDVYMEAFIVQTRRRWSSYHKHALQGCNWVNSGEYLAVVNGRCTGCRDCIHQVVNFQLWECDEMTLPLTSHGELAGGSQSCRKACQKLKLHSGVNLLS